MLRCEVRYVAQLAQQKTSYCATFWCGLSVSIDVKQLKKLQDFSKIAQNFAKIAILHRKGRPIESAYLPL
jgi:hypothetical protein